MGRRLLRLLSVGANSARIVRPLLTVITAVITSNRRSGCGDISMVRGSVTIHDCGGSGCGSYGRRNGIGEVVEDIFLVF